MKFLTSILVASLTLLLLAKSQATESSGKNEDAGRHHDGGRPGHGHPKPPKPPTHGSRLPAAPTQLTAAAVSEFQINLTWTDNATNELGFKIERSANGTNYTQIAQVLANTTRYRDLNRFPDTKYFYRVRAFNAAGNSAYSNVARTQTPAPVCELSISEGRPYALALVPLEASPFAAIAVGDHHGLALKTDGTVTSWGLDYAYDAASTPTNLTGVVAIAAGGMHSLALRSNGTVVAWGGAPSVYGAGAGEPPTNLTGVVAITAGSSHSLALEANGTVVGWGYDGEGAATPPAKLAGVVAIAAGGHHSLALKSDGTVVGWGFNHCDQATPPANLTNVVAIAAGTFHSLALKSDGTVVSWGCNYYDQATTPTNLTGVTAIAAGNEFSAALLGDGTVVAWGYGPFDSSHLGPSLTGVAAITAGGPQFLALSTTPNPPITIGLSVLATNRIVVVWQDNSVGHNRFNIERAPWAGNYDIGDWEQIGAVGTGANSFADATVTPNAAYAYRVRAENECNVSKPSQLGLVTITPPMQPPALYVYGYADQARFTGISSEAGITGYKLERAPDLDGNPGDWSTLWTTNFSYLSTYFSYTNAGLALNTTYWYRLRVVNGLGRSPYSVSVSVTIVPPRSPNNPSARIGASNQVNLTWSAFYPNDQQGFQVERSTDKPGANEAWTEIATLTNNSYTGTYTDLAVIANTTYRYRVRAFNLLGASLPSPEAVIRIAAPTAPVLGATVFANNIQLAWYNPDYPGDIAQFKLERANDAGGTPGLWVELATIANPNNNFYHEYTDPGRRLDQTYWYRVRAINWLGTSPFSLPVSATIVRPTPPVNFTARISTNGVNLAWYAAVPYDQSGFTIERALETNSAAGAWKKIATVTATNYINYSYNDAPLIAGQAYWYRIQAFNLLGVSSNSGPIRIELEPPPAPAQISAQPFANRVNLAWNYYSYPDTYGMVDGFKIERARDVAGSPETWSQIATLTGPYSGYYADTNLVANTAYWYRIRAFNWLGVSPPSLAASATILPPAAPPAPAPRIGSTNEVLLEVFAAAPFDEDGFKVERADDASGAPGIWSEIGTIATAGAYNAFYTDTNVTAHTTNWYRTRMFNVLGVSAYSPPARIRIVPPDAPTSLAATPFANQVTLWWYMNYAGYGQVDATEIERANDAGGAPGTWTKIGTNNGGYNNFTDKGLATDTYWYRVRTSNWVGASPASDPVRVTIIPPAAPGNLSATLGTSNRVELAWNTGWPYDQDGIYVERAPDVGGIPGAWSPIATVPNTNLYYGSYTDKNVTANTTNWYRLRAFNITGVSPYSPPASIAIVPPATPLNLVGYPDVDRVQLAWYPGAGVASQGFNIERANDSNGNPGTWARIATLRNQPDSRYTDTGRAADTTYWYRVQAFNWVGASPLSDSISVTIIPPRAPENLSGHILTTNVLRLDWTLPYSYSFDADGSKIERAPDTNGIPGPWTEIAIIPATNNYYASFTDTNVLAYTTNWYRVRSFNQVGVSAPSAPFPARIIPPPAPQYLSASAFADQVQLAWNGDYYNYGLVQGFEIERAEDVAGSPENWSRIDTVKSGVSYGNYTDTGRPANSTWWYRVRAYNWIGPSEFSAVASATIVPPKAPYNLNAHIGTTNRVEVSWSAGWPADQSGFYLERAPAAGGVPGAWSQIAILPATNNYYGSYTDTNVTASTTNWYRVRAYNVVGGSPYSQTTHIGITPPGAPGYFYATAFGNQINLSWSSSFYDYGEVAGYKLERAPNAGGLPGTWTQIAVLPGVYPSSYTDTNLPAGSTFWYRVHAYNWIGDGTRTPPANATIIPPAAPNNLTSTIGTTNTINLFWYAGNPQDQDFFKVEWATDASGIPGTWTEIAIIPATNNYYGSFADTNVTAYTTNWYRVRSVNIVGVSAYSPPLAARVLPPPAPQSFTTSPFADQVQLTWYGQYYNYGLIQGFEIERAEDVAGSPGTWRQVGSTFASDFRDTERAANSAWWYRVRAYNWIGPGEFSAATSVTIVPPKAPYNLSTYIGTSNRVEVNWYAGSPTDQSGFYLERATDAGGVPGVWSPIATIPSTNTYYGRYTDTNIFAFTTNWYRVRAYNVVGVSPYSQTTRIGITPPISPGYLNAAPFANRVNVSWGNYFYGYGEVAGYKLERAPDASGSPGAWTQIASLTTAYTSYYTDTNLPASATFWYRVRAYNWIGDGERTPPVKATIIPPGAPNNLTTTLGLTNTVNLLWYGAYPWDHDYFTVEWSPDTNGVPGGWTEIGSVPATNVAYATFTHANVLAYTTNWYRVRAYNLVGVSDYSVPVSASIVPPPAPFYLIAYAYENRVTLYWSGDSAFGILGSKLERAPDLDGGPGTWTQIARPTGQYGNYEDRGLTNNGTYWYRVQVYNWIGDSPFAPPTSATITWYDPSPVVTSTAILINEGGLHITSLLLTNNNALITWSTIGTTTNVVEVSPNLAGEFSEVSPRIVIGGSGNTMTNYLDVGAFTNSASRFYRIRLLP